MHCYLLVYHLYIAVNSPAACYLHLTFLVGVFVSSDLCISSWAHIDGEGTRVIVNPAFSCWNSFFFSSFLVTSFMLLGALF
ncbi:hypothetical protein V8F33_008141 [Rhypophila sp. PSN 637]